MSVAQLRLVTTTKLQVIGHLVTTIVDHELSTVTAVKQGKHLMQTASNMSRMIASTGVGCTKA